MHSKKRMFGCAAVLLILLVLLPAFFSADAREGQKAKISPGLAKELSAAKPDDFVTAIVRMSDRADIRAFSGNRQAVFSELRRTSGRSQEAMVRFLEGPDSRAHVRLFKRFWLDNIVLVRAKPHVISRLAERPDVEEVFENFTVTLPPRQENPDRTDLDLAQTQLWDSIDKIGAKQVWTSYGISGSGVVIGGIDTGVDITHPDISGKMVTTDPVDLTYPGGWAEFDAEGNMVSGSLPHDTDGHGTHTSGTMIGGNASGFDIGVAPGAQLMHALVLPGGTGTFAQVTGGMEWIIDPDDNPATDDGCRVVNMSLGASGTYTAMIAPVDNMIAANVFPAISIGNSGPGSGTTGSPGNVPSAFGVGYTDSMDVIANLSSRGPVTWDYPPYVGTYIKPDITSPGVKIYSSVPGATWEWHGVGWDWSGTSMAAPHTAGTAALMFQANPMLDVELAKQLIALTAIDLGVPGKDNTYGWGRINAFSAVGATLSGVGTVEGTVYSSAGGTVENARILFTDNGQRNYSDELGHYSLQAVAGDHTVEVSRFGYATYTTAVTVIADDIVTLDVTLNQLPSGTIAGFVTDSESGMGIETDITVQLAGENVLATSTNPSTGEYSVVLPIGTYDLVYSPVFPYPVTMRTGIDVFDGATTTVDVTLDRAQVLIVDDDTGDPYETYYENAVTAAGRSYLTVTTPPSAADMAPFETVIWFTGDDFSTTLTADDQTNIAVYLDAGGRLFITGQDIGYDIRGSAFYADYLHAVYVQDDVSLGAVIGEIGNPIGYGFSFDIQGGSGANNQAYPSEIDVIYPGQTAFIYDESVLASAVTGNGMEKGQVATDGITSSGTAALTYDGAYKLVYLAFGFEAVAEETTRNMLMGRILDWLLGYPEIAHEPLGNTEDTENPHRVSAYITSAYFDLDPSTFVLVYDVGEGDIAVPMASTGVPDEYEAYIPEQGIDTEVYYYIAASDVEGHTSTHPMGAPMNRHMFQVGWDDEPPTVVHVRHYNTNDLEGPYHIYAEMYDNFGIESAYLMCSKNGGMFHRVKMIQGEDGRYHGEILGPSVVGDVYEYHLYAMDKSYHGNVTQVPESGEFSFEIVEFFLWDFELDDGGFVESGNIWEWGEPTSGPGGANSGVKLWGTNLDGSYPNNADATLDMPPITLSASKPYALLTFWHWYYIETNYDGGNVKVSADDGETWEVVTPLGGYDGTAKSGNAGIPGEPCFTGYNDDFWQMELFDLSAYAGSQVIIRFHFGSDGSMYRDGWYVDDVMVRSSDTDDIPPIISGTEVPTSTFDPTGPYNVSANIVDFLGDVSGAYIFYSTDDGMTWTETAMTEGADDEWSGAIPGQPHGTRIKLYVKATDTSSNESTDPMGAPAEAYEFAILPSAPILVMQGTSSSTPLEMFHEALGTYGYQADYWYRPGQGWLALDKLELYKIIVLDESSGLTTDQRSDLAAWLEGGSPATKRRLFIMGRDLGWSSLTRPWVEEYLRAAYVQDNPGWRELTGYPGEFIGADETFVISGSYPDEMQRSTAFPGGKIVYQYTGPGSASFTRGEIEEEYQKAEKEWDGVMPHDPRSTDAAAGIKYNGNTYRSVYFSFNFHYIQETARRADIMDRTLRWLSMPDIVHEPLHTTEDTLSAYIVAALVYSETLDASRVNLTYDVGMGDVTVQMSPTANPDEYAADIPPQKWGTTVTYYISATNTDGNTSYDPSGAPAQRHIFDVTADYTPPEIVHAPLGNSANLAGPYAVEAVITDNVGVNPSTVFLTYNKNGGANTTMPMTAVGGDVYRAEIPGPSALSDTYNYYILAQDIATIPNTARHPASGYHSFEIVDYYAWDFEASNGGFGAAGPDWEWGDPTTGPMDAYSGVNVWATILDGNYSYSSNSRLETPVITVPTSGAYAALSFWQWYYMERSTYSGTCYDGGNVKISSDGGSTWTILMPDIGYIGNAGSSNAGIPGEPCFSGYDHDYWHKATFDLSAYKGQPVILRWHFGSDGSVNKVGWYIDDVRIESVEDTEAPVFVSTTVPTSTYDTVGPYTVTTTVIDALSGIAAVTLHYSIDDGTIWTPVVMAPTGALDEYGGDIPGQDAGTRIKLYVEAADNAANTAVDPAGAPATTYEFGIMLSSDCLVILGGYSHTPAEMFQLAFSAIGKTADIWDWDDVGVPTVGMLHSYQTVIVDESGYIDATQQSVLGPWLDTDDGDPQRVFFLGRDLSYYSSYRAFMEQYTGAAYVKDDPSWRELTSEAGDPIGADETFVIQGNYPDELSLSDTYLGAHIIYRYSALGSSLDLFGSEQDVREFYEKEAKEWDPRVWPLVPQGPDTVAAVRYTGPHHAAVYFAFNYNYIQEETRRAAILDRVLDWLATPTDIIGKHDFASGTQQHPEIPTILDLWQNYPNPFNPVTSIRLDIPAGMNKPVQVRIYNVKGELIRTLFEGIKTPGVHTFKWDGSNERGRKVTSGIYFCRMAAGDVRIVKKMVLLR